MEKIKISLISFITRVLFYIINKTLKYRVIGFENYLKLIREGKKIIFAFWHNGIFMATYFWRFKKISVLTSKNFDGEYTAKVIKRYGYEPIRGSTSRDSIKGLIEMKKEIEKGANVAFTVDGPRGPKYKVQAGAIWLAMKTKQPILPFIAFAEKKIELKSWDSFQIPLPFSTVWIIIGEPLYFKDEKNIIDEAKLILEKKLNQLLRFAQYCNEISLARGITSERSC